MELIKDLKQGEFWNEGKLFVPLFNIEIDVAVDFDVERSYAEECAQHLVNLSEAIIDVFCNRAIRYYEFMLEAWAEYDFYDDVVESITSTMPEKIVGREILKYVTPFQMYIEKPKKPIPAFSLGCECVWEPEHGLEWIVCGDNVLYVGESVGLGPWADDDEYKVIY